jgi:hypothetical protein
VSAPKARPKCKRGRPPGRLKPGQVPEQATRALKAALVFALAGLVPLTETARRFWLENLAPEAEAVQVRKSRRRKMLLPLLAFLRGGELPGVAASNYWLHYFDAGREIRRTLARLAHRARADAERAATIRAKLDAAGRDDAAPLLRELRIAERLNEAKKDWARQLRKIDRLAEVPEPELIAEWLTRDAPLPLRDGELAERRRLAADYERRYGKPPPWDPERPPPRAPLRLRRVVFRRTRDGRVQVLKRRPNAASG